MIDGATGGTGSASHICSMIETQSSERTETQEGQPKILLVDDDAAVVSAVGDLLRDQGYAVRSITDPRKAVQAAEEFSPDLVVLDVLMPGIDGISLCLEIRRETDVPVLFLSAKHETPDRVVGLRIGADDYMGKPFDNEELLARIGALLRRPRTATEAPAAQRQMRFGRFVIDLAAVQAICGDQVLPLTPTEFKLLRTLGAEPGRVFSRDDLLTTVWGYEPGSDTRLVDVHVGRLRKKLQDASVDEVAIETSRGFGYRLTAKA